GKNFVDAGKTAAKVTGGLGAASGIAGLAGVRKHLQEKGNLKKNMPPLKNPDSPIGGGGSGIVRPNRVSGQLPGDTKKSPFGFLTSPKEQGWTMTDPLTQEVHQGPGVNGYWYEAMEGAEESASSFGLGSDFQATGEESASANMGGIGDNVFRMAGMSGPSGGPFDTSSATNPESTSGRTRTSGSIGGMGTSAAGLFDPASRSNGAYTRMMPSSKEKLAALEGRPSYQNAMEAFFGEAGRRLKQDIHHKATGGRRSGYAGANNLLGVAMQEFGGAGAEGKIRHDTTLPSKELLKAADEGAPEAIEDLNRIGQYQGAMEQGLQWMLGGEEWQQRLAPIHESAQQEYQAAEDEVNVRAVELDMLRHANQEGTPAFAQRQTAYREAVARRDSAQKRYESIHSQMERARNLSQRGEKRIIDSQNAIGKINWKYYKSPSQSMVRQAQIYANRVGLSDLSSPAGARGLHR
ncbi:MAG: hypothetical protein K6T63_16020, partial [Alicyclobacillus herbarius]|uniref:hypothetical protein n=1 Tax=Alicyclobacillus herbarius TaxID=122960 RepID=UPI0023551D23